PVLWEIYSVFTPQAGIGNPTPPTYRRRVARYSIYAPHRARSPQHLECGFGCTGRLRRRRRIVPADDDQRRRLDLGQEVAVVHVAHRPATGDIAFERRGREHLRHARDRLGRALAESLAEPALHVRARERRHAIRAHELEPVVPRGLVGEVAGSVGEHEPLDALWRVGAEP